MNRRRPRPFSAALVVPHLIGLTLLASPTVAAAQDAAPAGDRLAEPQLDAVRGGLRTPSGLEFGFGAVVRAYVDGALALESQVTWTDQGAVETETARAAGLAPADDPALAALGWSGLVIPGEGGSTALLHGLDQGAVTNIVLNTASNRNIRQETLVTLNLPTLDQVRKDALAARMGSGLSDAVASALTTAAVR
jgi:hypothetical protein